VKIASERRESSGCRRPFVLVLVVGQPGALRKSLAYPDRESDMAKQGDTDSCNKTGCKGTMTYHEKLKVDLNADPTVRPSGMVGGRPDVNYSGWLCDTCHEVLWDKP